MQVTMERAVKNNPVNLMLRKARTAFGGTPSSQRYVNRPIGEVHFDDDFFSTVSFDQPEREVAMQHEAMSMDDLPSVGKENTVYIVTSTQDQYKWINGNYVSHNPYMEASNEGGRLLIVDDSAYLPHGGAVSTRIIYNIWALRADLALMARLNLAYEDVMVRGSITVIDDEARIRQKYMIQNHKALTGLLRQNVVIAGQLNNELLNRLAKIGVDVWVGENGSIGFKDNTFVVSI